MQNHRKWLAGAVAGLLAVSAQAAAIGFNFSADTQGWTVFDGGALAWRSAGGNPGGYLEIGDASDGDFRLEAPAAALGDWSAYLGGTLRFDAKNLDGATPDWGGFGLVEITGLVGGASRTLTLDIEPGAEPAIGAGWKTYSVALTPELWGADLAAVLANLTRLTIEPEFHAGQPELVGVDNIRIASAAVPGEVPEPGALGLVLAGLGLLAAQRGARPRA
ncbi:PEP-CTERM sorting domain-containing protein [Pseudorhodoferax sp.]|uniref:PEP-CTERM sorting domain-containing protein n=1 Tax=Pseudorhodoferax sp. TaxID=1993553 RepID=UPI002DD63951|nr:PEP-CTERM sorting domain-containing protein [Pseudorhodoferax sp.]